MRNISEYQDKLFNHQQGFYRPGDRDLAVELMEAFDLTCVDVPVSETVTLVRVHPSAEDQNTVDNVMFLCEMPPAQAKLDTLLQERVSSDRELGGALSEYLESARNGDNTPHFGVHYQTSEGLGRALDKLKGISPALSKRVKVTEMPSYGSVADFPDIRQVFVRTDVFAVGWPVFGQTIELQVERGK